LAGRHDQGIDLHLHDVAAVAAVAEAAETAETAEDVVGAAAPEAAGIVGSAAESVLHMDYLHNFSFCFHSTNHSKETHKHLTFYIPIRRTTYL